MFTTVAVLGIASLSLWGSTGSKGQLEAANNARWVAAENLKPGDQLLTRSGSLIPITTISVDREKKLTVYNLEIAKKHNYASGERKILVHNGDCNRWAIELQDGELDVALNVRLDPELLSKYSTKPVTKPAHFTANVRADVKIDYSDMTVYMEKYRTSINNQ